MSIRPRRIKLDPDQMPLITPDSSWVRPSELPPLTGVEEFALDTETKDDGLGNGEGPGWATRRGYVAGVSLAWREGTDIRRIYVPVRHPETENFPRDQVARWVTDITRKRRVIFFNAGYDIGWLGADMNVPVPPVIDDSSCAAFLVDENRLENDLDTVCEWRGVPGKDTSALKEAALAYGFAPKDAVANISRLPARYAGIYGEGDAVSTLLLMENLRPELARQGLLRAYDTEMRLIPLIHHMRKVGIRLDIPRAERLRDQLYARRDRVLAALSDRLKMRIGMDEIRSSGWLIRTFDQEKAPYNMREEKASFEKEWMRASEHWLPLMVAEAKQCHDTADKFVQGYLLNYVSSGRIHASINQFRTEEGGTRSQRLSYANPPLQQAPSRPDPVESWTLTWEIAQEYRGCFLPEEGDLWFSPDYSQQEYRHIVSDAEELGCTKAGVAAEMYRTDPKTDFHNLVVTLTGLTRRRAKDCNFAKAFGAGIPKFAAMTGMELDEAAKTMGQYDEEMPFVRELAQRIEKLAQRRGYIRMIDGARAHFDTWEASWLSAEERSRGWGSGYRMAPCSLDEATERAKDSNHPWHGKRLKRSMTHKAMNRRIQGGAARQMKMAMVQCWEEGYAPLIQMHDELGFSLRDPKIGERVEEIMRTVYTCRVPFLVDAEWGTTWGNAKHSHAGAVALLAPEAGANKRPRGRAAKAG